MQLPRDPTSLSLDAPSRRFYIGLFAVLAVLLFAAAILRVSVPDSLKPYVLMFILGVIPIPFLITSLRERRLRNLVETHNCFVCPCCCYPFSSSSLAFNRCPECGCRLNMDNLRTFWERRFKWPFHNERNG